VSDFFEPGKTYLHHGEDGRQSTEGLFRVEYVGRAPEPFESYDETAGVAFGWRQGVGPNGVWEALGSYSTPDYAGWQEVRRGDHQREITPDGCRWCGDAPGHHGQQYLPGVGLHQWEQPSDRQRLERMQARRTDRSA
jgi:hypothetical protein